MSHILIISSSIRKGRKSHRVALFLKNFIEKTGQGTADIADLEAYDFPLFEERLRFTENPSESVLELSGRIKSADGVIIVTPEYNGGYPASLKNVIDFYYDEWHHKPVAISTVSDGVFGGSQVITSLQFILWKMKAITVTAMFPVPKVGESLSEDGTPADPQAFEKRASVFINELFWYIGLLQNKP